MATTPAHGSAPAPATTPGAAYLNITDRMQAFYSARGMWHNGGPRGELTAMLGDPVPWRQPGGTGLAFWVSAEQLHALQRDLETSPASAALSGQARAQFQRRFREAADRAGLPRYASAALARMADQPAPAARRAAPAHADPFSPLVIPAAGRARAAFEKHVFDCLHDVVDFAQTSAYGA